MLCCGKKIWFHFGFTNRVVNDCNRLGRHVVSVELIGSFKRRLDQNMDRDDR